MRVLCAHQDSGRDRGGGPVGLQGPFRLRATTTCCIKVLTITRLRPVVANRRFRRCVPADWPRQPRPPQSHLFVGCAVVISKRWRPFRDHSQVYCLYKHYDYAVHETCTCKQCYNKQCRVCMKPAPAHVSTQETPMCEDSVSYPAVLSTEYGVPRTHRHMSKSGYTCLSVHTYVL